MKKLKVLFASAEVAPLVKVGGLADVAGALPKALANHDIDVRIIMPKYDIIDKKKYPASLLKQGLVIKTGKGKELVNIHTTTLPNSAVTVYLVDSKKYFHHGSVYFEKTTFVNSISDVEKFVFFSKVAIDVLPQLGWEPDIIHCHDWHTGLVPALKDVKEETNPFFKNIRTLFTIHNAGSQGAWSAKDILNFLKLKENQHKNFSERQKNGNFLLLEQGIIGGDAVNTVSPTYAKEILTPEFGLGLEGQLQKRHNEGDLFGILNGIDVQHFDPATDPALKHHYSAANPAKMLANKAELQKWAGLRTADNIPVFGFVGRLFDQKGFDLLEPIAEKFLINDVQLIILGTGLEQHEVIARKLEKKFPDKVKAEIAFDAELAQLIYAGSDIFLMPSRFEPCGLGQMIAMRYGTPPIVNATGGLKDTVVDVSNHKTGTGFVMKNATSEELETAMSRAIEAFADKKLWQKIVRNGMKTDFSWDHSSLEYLKLYQSLVK
jgi:starch synthase